VVVDGESADDEELEEDEDEEGGEAEGENADGDDVDEVYSSCASSSSSSESKGGRSSDSSCASSLAAPVVSVVDRREEFTTRSGTWSVDTTGAEEEVTGTTGTTGTTGAPRPESCSFASVVTAATVISGPGWLFSAGVGSLLWCSSNTVPFSGRASTPTKFPGL
jgi:hypothetical protein